MMKVVSVLQVGTWILRVFKNNVIVDFQQLTLVAHNSVSLEM